MTISAMTASTTRRSLARNEYMPGAGNIRTVLLPR
jgi:hypothetical protein